MILETTRFGRIQLREEDVISFPDGIPGFPQAKRFVLLEHSPESPFHWLQNLDDGALAFVVMDPLLVDKDYLASIPQGAVKELGMTEAQEAAVLVIVRIDRNAMRVTANLLAPLVINPETRTGRQIILLGSNYGIRHVLSARSGSAT